MKIKTFLLTVAAGILTLPASAREWTDSTGRKIQAELVEVKDGKTAVLKMANGQSAEVPLAKLSAADQAYALEAKPAATSATAAPAGKPSIFADMLKNKLVALNGKRVGKYEMTEEPQHYAFYFSAHWCPPCRAFTPKLVEFYNAQEGRKKDFEIIFVTRDHDEESFEEYIKGDKMPWPAISFRSAERMKEINKYCGAGIPCFVLVDREGKVLSDSYVGKDYVGPEKVMNDIPKMTKGK